MIRLMIFAICALLLAPQAQAKAPVRKIAQVGAISPIAHLLSPQDREQMAVASKQLFQGDVGSKMSWTGDHNSGEYRIVGSGQFNQDPNFSCKQYKAVVRDFNGNVIQNETRSACLVDNEWQHVENTEVTITRALRVAPPAATTASGARLNARARTNALSTSDDATESLAEAIGPAPTTPNARPEPIRRAAPAPESVIPSHMGPAPVISPWMDWDLLQVEYLDLLLTTPDSQKRNVVIELLEKLAEDRIMLTAVQLQRVLLTYRDDTLRLEALQMLVGNTGFRGRDVKVITSPFKRYRNDADRIVSSKLKLARS